MIKKRHKVAQILEATGGGGTTRHLMTLAMELDQSKFEVHVICSVKRNQKFWRNIEILKSKKIKVYTVQMMRKPHLWKDLISLIRIWRIFIKERYDIVHCHSSKAGFLGRLAAKVSRIPLAVYTPNAFAFKMDKNFLIRGLYIILEWLAGHWTNRLICVSKEEREEALRYRLVSKDRIVVIPNWVNLDEFGVFSRTREKLEELGISKHNRVVGTVADLRLQKGHEFLLKTVPQVLRYLPDTTFLIIGEGDRREALEEMIQQLRIDNCVVMTGHRRDVPELYPLMDVYVLPSLWEGLPYTILEAMACRCPVIATDISGNREILSDGVGLLVPPRSPVLLGEAIVRLLTDQQLADRLSSRGRQRIEERYQMSAQINRIEKVYEEASIDRH